MQKCIFMLICIEVPCSNVEVVMNSSMTTAVLHPGNDINAQHTHVYVGWWPTGYAVLLFDNGNEKVQCTEKACVPYYGPMPSDDQRMYW